MLKSLEERVSVLENELKKIKSENFKKLSKLLGVGDTFELAKELGVLIEDNKDWIYMMKCRKAVQYSTFFIGLSTLAAILCLVIFL